MRSRRIPPFLLALLACAALVPASLAAPARTGTAAPAGPAKPKRVVVLLYGDDHVFGIAPPPGWVVDDSSGLGSKIRVVLYPRGQKWSTAPTVIYSNPIHQDPQAPRPFAEVVAGDVAAFRKQSPRGKVTSGAPIRNVRGQMAEVRYFAPEGGEPQSAVAYFEEKELVMLLVLDSKTPAGFRAALPGFNDMVASYRFVGGNMQTPTTRPRRDH